VSVGKTPPTLAPYGSPQVYALEHQAQLAGIDLDCVFRTMSDADSGRWRTAIPAEAER
jgi:hypothetical protein